MPLTRVILAGMLLLTLFIIAPAGVAQTPNPSTNPVPVQGNTPSGLAGSQSWVVDELMAPFQSSRVRAISSSGTGRSNDLGSSLGLNSQYVSSGIGGQFLGAILGADTMNRASSWFPGTPGFGGARNTVFDSILKFGSLLGVLFTFIFLTVHGFTAFFNKMEYGDIMGKAEERFIGGFRAVVAFGLIMPISVSQISGATHGVGMVAAGANGVGNKAAETVINGGFGNVASNLTSIAVNHDPNTAGIAETLAEMVAQDTCINRMRSMGASAPETNRTCGGYISPSSNELDVEVDSGSADTQSDADFCRAADHGGGIFSDDRFGEETCQHVRRAQRTTQERVSELIEAHDGDLSSPEAREELAKLSNELQSEIGQHVEELNNHTFGGQGYEGGSGGGYLHQELSGFIEVVGWPGLGMIYSSIGAQIDAVNSLQSSNMTRSSDYYADRLSDAGVGASRALRQVQENAAIARASGMRGGAVGGGGEIEGPGWMTSAEGFLAEWSTGLISDLWGRGTDGVESGSRWLMRFFFTPVFEDPGPVATHKVGTTILGSIALAAGVADFVGLFDDEEGGSEGSGTAEGATFFSKVFEKVGTDFSENSIIANLLVAYLSIILMLCLFIATFLVLILPKLPIFFVAFLALEWAIWCAILIFAAPLWVALNLTSVNNQPGLFTQRALSGLGVLAYLFLFPALVVVSVVISLVAYNLIIPTLGMMLLVSFSGGGMGSLLGAFALPAIMLLTLSISSFVAISAIVKGPPMITSLLGIQSPGDGVSQQAMTFIASPMSYNNVTNPQSVMTRMGSGMMKR